MKKLESLKKSELIEIILRKDEVEKSLRADISNLEGYCTELSTSYGEACQKVVDLQEDLDKDEEEIKDLNHQINTQGVNLLECKKVVSSLEDTLNTKHNLIDKLNTDIKMADNLNIFFGSVLCAYTIGIILYLIF